jgi:hypothetical protein
MEEFYHMPPELRHLYMASDCVAAEDRKNKK